MPVIGITGGIASGKSTFRQLMLERVQAESFDADACAKELLAGDEDVRQQVREGLHPQAYDSTGMPDRELLRGLIYQDATKKKILEGILHPAVRRRWTDRAKRATDEGRLLLVDIPLLFETQAESFFNRIVTVACSHQTQLDRLRVERGLAVEISEKIIASQLPMRVKITRAHHVIWNDGSREALISQTELFSCYLNDRFG